MSRLDPETNQWLCKIVLFTPITEQSIKLSKILLETLPEAECTLYSAEESQKNNNLVATYTPKKSNLNDIQPIYAFHMLGSADSTATDRQFLLGNVDGVVLVIDTENIEASTDATLELERFLGRYGKMISKLPVVLVSDRPLSEAQLQQLRANDLSVFSAESKTGLERTVSTLIDRLEQDSGLAGISFDLDEIDDEKSELDWDDVEFDDLHDYDDDEDA